MKKSLLYFILVIILDTRIVCSDFFEQYHIILSDCFQKKILGVIVFFFVFIYILYKCYIIFILNKTLHIFDQVILMFFTPLVNAYILLAIVFAIRNVGYGMLNLFVAPLAILFYFVFSFFMWFLLFRKLK